jgi:MYXO-CTERM domain-containing protein
MPVRPTKIHRQGHLVCWNKQRRTPDCCPAAAARICIWDCWSAMPIFLRGHTLARRSMKSRFSFFLLVAVASLSIPATFAQTPVNPSYTVIDLGTLGSVYSEAFGINNSGQVTGVSSGTSGSRAFLYSGGTMTNLGTLSGGNTSYGFGINAFGQVAGYSANASTFFERAFLYSSGTMSDFDSLGGTLTSDAYAVNDLGQVTGASSTKANRHAFLVSGGIMRDLGTLGGETSLGYAINNAGQVTGGADTVPGYTQHAFLYSGGVLGDLGTLGGTQSKGFGINASGQVTGNSLITGNGANHAFLYSGGIMTDLGTLGGTNSVGYALNAFGQVTGSSAISGSSAEHAFLFSGGTMYDLNNLVGANPIATNIRETNIGNHINDWGQIAATGTVIGLTHAVLLSPVDPLTSTSDGGTTRDTRLISGMSYHKFTATANPGDSHTMISLLDGTAGSAGSGTFGLNRDVVVTLAAGAPGLFASDVVTLTGTEGDVIVLQLTYDEALASSLFGKEANSVLSWLDPSDGEWKNAVDGNTGGTSTFVAGAYDPMTDFHLGYYGVDVANNTVWAVINHNSQFAVTAVPEPSSAGVAIGLGVLGLALTRRRRHRA